MCKWLINRLAAAVAVTFLVAILTISVMRAPGALAADAGAGMMDVPSLKPGMKGTAMTVFEGTKPEGFDVEIIGVMRRGGQLGDMILVRASGPAVEAAGGIAEGMSGSPVYVDGKLIGAIAYVFPGSDHFVAGVTPIADMVRILGYPEAPADVAAVQAGRGPWEAPAPAGARAATSIVVSGLSGRALGKLSKSLEQFGATVRSAISLGAASASSAESASHAGSTAGGHGAAEIVPGSAIALQLAQGDVEITAFGSVTYVEGDRFLAFGHPVLGNGATDLAASGALVHGVIKSDSTPFKVLSSTEWVGAFTQDRLSGVAGKFGRKAGAIPVSVTVVDTQTGREKTVSLSVAPEELLVADIFGSAALAAFDGTLDRVGGGTAAVDLQIELAGREPYERQDTFWSGTDVAGASLSDAFDAVDLIANNAVERAKIERISLKAQVGAERRTAMIEKARVLQKAARPGDQVDVEVTLRVFRGPRVTRILSLVIPDDIGSGTVSLMVRGGSVNVEDEFDSLSVPADELLYMDVDEMLAQLRSRPLGNDIVLELEPYLPEEPEVDLKTPIGPEPHRDGVSSLGSAHEGKEDKGNDKPNGAGGVGDAADDADVDAEDVFAKPVSVRTQADWVIQGVKWITVNIEGETEPETEQEVDIEAAVGADTDAATEAAVDAAVDATVDAETVVVTVPAA